MSSYPLKYSSIVRTVSAEPTAFIIDVCVRSVFTRSIDDIRLVRIESGGTDNMTSPMRTFV